MKEKRKNVRYLSSAQIRVVGKQDLVLFLRDISTTGCSITNVPGDTQNKVEDLDSQAALAASSIFTLQNKVEDLDVNREYKIEIYPETDAGVEPFELVIELSWIRSENGVYEAGGFISGYPKGKRYQQFANYLAWRAASL
jgi:hypothetical protein